jgi:hypothetical protein
LLENGKILVWFYDYFDFLKLNEILSKSKIILIREKKLTSNSLDSNLAKNKKIIKIYLKLIFLQINRAGISEFSPLFNLILTLGLKL